MILTIKTLLNNFVPLQNISKMKENKVKHKLFLPAFILFSINFPLYKKVMCTIIISAVLRRVSFNTITAIHIYFLAQIIIIDYRGSEINFYLIYFLCLITVEWCVYVTQTHDMVYNVFI